jgi:hypothetical protein
MAALIDMMQSLSKEDVAMLLSKVGGSTSEGGGGSASADAV